MSEGILVRVYLHERESAITLAVVRRVMGRRTGTARDGPVIAAIAECRNGQNESNVRRIW